MAISAKSNLLFSSSKSSSVYGKRKIANVGHDSMLFLFRSPWEANLTFHWSFRILITGGSSGLVETITDAVSIHSIKKAEYACRLAEGRLGHVSLMDHFKNVSFYCMTPVFVTHIHSDLRRSLFCEVRPCPAKLRKIAGGILYNHPSSPDQRPTQRQHPIGP